MKIVIRRYEVILLGSILLLSGAVIPSSWDPPLHQRPRPTIDLTPKHPWIALTFDDGPHPRMTARLLDVLRHEHVPATFFVVGKMAARYPTILQQVAQEGHEIANHTYNHPSLSRLEDVAVLAELSQTRSIVRRLTGQDAILYRPPGGDYNRRVTKVASQAGYRMVLWTVLTKDVNGASSAFIRKRILRGAEDNGIILMHSGVQNTVDVLPDVIAELRRRGYSFVTVSQLMGFPHQQTPLPVDLPMMRIASAK